jgi:hypothetical protein
MTATGLRLFFLRERGLGLLDFWDSGPFPFYLALIQTRLGPVSIPDPATTSYPTHKSCCSITALCLYQLIVAGSRPNPGSTGRFGNSRSAQAPPSSARTKSTHARKEIQLLCSPQAGHFVGRVFHFHHPLDS